MYVQVTFYEFYCSTVSYSNKQRPLSIKSSCYIITTHTTMITVLLSQTVRCSSNPCYRYAQNLRIKSDKTKSNARSERYTSIHFRLHSWIQSPRQKCSPQSTETQWLHRRIPIVSVHITYHQSSQTFTLSAPARIFPQLTASSGFAPASLPSNSALVLI
jgi:hypothetical protein